MDEPNDRVKELAKTYKDARRLSARKRVQEILIWIFLAGFVSTGFWSDFIFRANGNLRLIGVIIGDNGLSFFGSIFVLVFPLLFNQIFGDLPFSLIRRRSVEQDIAGALRVGAGSSVNIGSIQLSDPTSVTRGIEAQVGVEALRKLDPRDLLGLYAERTSELTREIYGRAGVYLMVGVIISFIGLVFFYIRSRDIQPGPDYIDRLLSLLPGFGILFFIEFIAFFFLRQYRSAMDEFRYFDAIRRNREENLVIMKMFGESPTIIATKDVLACMHMYSSAGKLVRGETTEMLETRKMQKDEIFIFEKLIDAISAIKEQRKESGSK